MKFCFLDQTNFEYSYKDKYSPILRGAETILINLSDNLKPDINMNKIKEKIIFVVK